MATDPNHVNTPEETVLANLLRRVGELEKDVHKLKTDTVIRKTELPVEVLKENGMLDPEPKTLRRGRGSRHLLISEVLDAKEKFPRNESACAKYLGISYTTYRKYCRQFQLWGPMKGKWSVKP